MRRRSIWLAMLGAAAALAVVVASAAAVSAPPGTPDLSQMTLQAADLAPGATVAIDQYETPPTNFLAEYVRSFAKAKTPAGLALAGLDSRVLLGKTAAVTTSFFALERRLYSSKSGRKLLAKGIVGELAKTGATTKDVHFEKFRSLRLGSQAFLQAIVVRVKGKSVAADFVVMRVGAVLTDVSVALAKPKSVLSVANQLGKDVVAHITAVLAASGPTGPSGASGPTGTT
jgi:hypothetical protein